MNDLEQSAPRWSGGRLEVFLLILLCLSIYLPSLHHGFVLDDRWLVIENPYIKSWGYLAKMLTQDAWNIWDHHNYWRPAFTVSLALDYSLWGLGATGFHLTNILLHAVNVAMLYSLGQRLQSARSAAVAALLFGVHPIQAQPVNLISIRGDLLAALFALLGLHAFFARRTVFFAVALLFALLSKETSMVLPVVLLFGWSLIQRENQGARITLAFVILGAYLAVRFLLGFSFSLPPSIFSYHAPWDIRWLLAFKVLALYFLALGNLFSMPHPFWTVEIPASLTDPYVLGGVLISALLIAATWAGSKRLPVAAFGILWFVAYFLPVSNLKELNQPMAEHWLYIPMIGLCLAFGVAVDASWGFLVDRAPLRAGILAGAVTFLVLGALVAREKTAIYRDDETFLSAAIQANPEVPKLYSILASVYLARQDVVKAKEFYTKALNLDPNDFLANYRIGFLYYRAGKPEEAKVYLQNAVRVEPRPLYEILSVAHAWEMLGDKEKALFYYRKALQSDPELALIQKRISALEAR